MPWEPSEEIRNQNGNSGNLAILAIWWLRLVRSHSQGSGSIPGQVTKIPQGQGAEAVQPKKESQS